MASHSRLYTLEETAEHLTQRFGPHIASLMAYGSRVCGRPRAGSAYDFWLIVQDPERFHHANADFYLTRLNVPSSPEKQIALNREGPLFYSMNEEGIELKLAVMGEEDFVRVCGSDWWTVKGRMQKPLRFFCSSPAVEAAVTAARREGLQCGLNLVPRHFGLEDLLREIVGLSYRAEIRPERKGAKVLSILDSGRTELEKIYRPLLEEVPFVEGKDDAYADLRDEDQRRSARAATLHALKRSKWCRQSLRFVWRNYCSHRRPIRYLLLKVAGEIEKVVRRPASR